MAFDNLEPSTFATAAEETAGFMSHIIGIGKNTQLLSVALNSKTADRFGEIQIRSPSRPNWASVTDTLQLPKNQPVVTIFKFPAAEVSYDLRLIIWGVSAADNMKGDILIYEVPQ